MKKIAIISPAEGKAMEYRFPNSECLGVQYNRSEIADAISDDYGWHDFFSSQRLAQKGFSAFILDRSCAIADAVRIILHLKLTCEWETCTLPVVWVTQVDYARITQSFRREVILPSATIHFINEMDFDNHEVLFAEINEALEAASAKPYSEDDFLKHIFLAPPTGSHDLTNEWGAYQLAQVAGLEPLLSQIASSKNRQADLYFKYLKVKNKSVEQEETDVQVLVPPLTTRANTTLSCLLIDDKHANGWSLVLNGILHKLFTEVQLELLNERDLEESDDLVWQKVRRKIHDYNPSIVFLDLRLRKEENSQNFTHTEIMNFSGGRLLEKIKEAYPYLSVIMFTASNKAWNMEQLLDYGADGYFIKPSLEIALDRGVLIRDYRAFEDLVVKCCCKHDVLMPFWQCIETILSETLIEERSTSAGATKVEERIRERLKMFFGLLKRSWEDKFYNKMFFYSDVELAFMTLWSCLNDLQYIYYDKTEPGVTNKNGRSTPSIKIEDYLINALQLSSDSRNPKFYLQRVKSGTKGFETTIHVEYNRTSGIFELGDWRDLGSKNFTERIGEQIAFLVLNFAKGTTRNSSSQRTNEVILADNLALLKAKRNHLFLIHGDESDESNFFNEVVENSRSIDIKDCARLYEIIHFLLKAEYIHIPVE